MLRIECPWCGLRDEQEFRFGGPSHVARPDVGVSDARWADYLFNRDNPKGVHHERWCHSFGCGRWFNVARDTVTHEMLSVYEMGEPKPRLERVPLSASGSGEPAVPFAVRAETAEP